MEALPSNTQAKGSLFVVPPGGLLPNRCVKCGAVPSEPWLDLTYSWHHPGLFLLLISPIIYLIVSLVVAKKVTLSVPLCSVHKEIRRERLWTGWLLLIACIPLPVAMAAYIANDAAATVALLLGLTLAIVGIGFLRAAAPLRATHIGPASAEFSGACPDVLDAMEQASEHGVSVTQPIPEVKDDTEPRTEIDQEAARIIREARDKSEASIRFPDRSSDATTSGQSGFFAFCSKWIHVDSMATNQQLRDSKGSRRSGCCRGRLLLPGHASGRNDIDYNGQASVGYEWMELDRRRTIRGDRMANLSPFVALVSHRTSFIHSRESATANRRRFTAV